MAGQPARQVIVVAGEAVDGVHGPAHRLLGDFRCHQAQARGVQQLVDIGQLRAGAGADHDVEVMIFGTPYVRPRRVFAHIEVVILIAFITRAEVKDRGAQAQ